MREKNRANGFISIILIGLLFTGKLVCAQIADGSLPASFKSNLKAVAVISQKTLQPIDIQNSIEVDLREGVQNRYGIVEDVSLNIREAGTHQQLGEMNIWQLEVKADRALSLGLIFSTFDVPEGATLYVYSPDRKTVRGAFTRENEKEGGVFRIADFTGDRIVVEYNEPIGVNFEGGVIIGAVVKAYRSLEASTNERIHINCPEGADWQIEKRAVCMINFRDGASVYYCSGSLVNNVREDGTSYFLTANHCISNASQAATMVIYFNYESPTCEWLSGSLSQSLSGAHLVASNAYSDFSLLELDEYPPVEYKPYFAGWDASGAVASSGTCIHHPQGTLKCIALDYDAFSGNKNSVRWDDGQVSQANSHWEVKYEAGKDEGGSSGAPLFDQNKRIIGQLHGGDEYLSLFGKFSLSWIYDSAPSRQLKYWLDPDNTGIKIINGLEGDGKPIAAFNAGFNILCLTESLQLTDESKFAPESWSWEISPSTYTFVNGTSAASQNPEVQFLDEGMYTISLTVVNEQGSDRLEQTDLIAVFAELPVQLVDLPDEMTMCGWELVEYNFVAEGAPDFSFDITADHKFVATESGNVLSVSLSDDSREEGSFDTYVKVTGTQGGCSKSDSVLIHVIIPENDNVAQALPLKLGNNGTYSNECGTVQRNEPAPFSFGCSLEDNWCPPISGQTLDNSIWFYFEGPSSGFIKIETTGIDSQIAVYRATTAEYLLSGSKASYILVAASDMGRDGELAAVIEEVAVTPGAKYWLQVDGTNGAEGDIGLRLLTNSIEVYPNPSSGVYHLTVASVSEGEAQMFVYNQSGQLIYSGVGMFDNAANTIGFDLSRNPAGIYYFRAIINDAVMSKKLILVK